MAGGSQGFGQGVVSRIAGLNQQNAPAPTGARFTPVSPNVYNPAFSSQQSGQAPVQQAPLNPAQQVQQAGLQALMANMMAQYQNVPGALAMTQQRPQMQMPRFSAPALAYRPNMEPAKTSLGRVAVSVAEQQRQAAVAEAARLRAENEALQAQQSQRNEPYYP